MKFSLLILLIIFSAECYSQTQIGTKPESKFFISAGYGLAGSFFVRSYEEFAPLARYKVFYKKHFVGVVQNAAVGINLKKDYQLRFGINFQHFTRRIVSKDTFNNVYINLNHTIHHRDYIWFGSINKNFKFKNHIFSPGLGLYYLRPKQEEVELYYPNYFANVENDYHFGRLEEGGVLAEFSYEYKFQPKVNLGIRTQFYYTASAGTAESITLFPYVKISF